MTGFEVKRCLEVRFETHGKFQAEVTEVAKIKARDEVEAAIRKARPRVLNASKQLTSLESIRKSHFAQARTMHKEQFTWKPAVVSVSRARVGGVGDGKDSALRWQKLLQEENTAESRKFQEYWRWFRVAESLPSSWCDSRNWTLRSQMSQMHWSMLLDASGIPCRSYKSNWQQSFPTCLRILQRRSLKIIDYRL